MKLNVGDKFLLKPGLTEGHYEGHAFINDEMEQFSRSRALLTVVELEAENEWEYILSAKQDPANRLEDAWKYREDWIQPLSLFEEE